MTRPTLEVADILRAHGDRFLDRYRSSFDFQQLKAFRAIQRCRTSDLGGPRDVCPGCGYQTISYNSCRNRHCPKCQAQARERWITARQRELLDTSYFHVVFTVPHELNVLALENPRLFYDLLFTASTQTLLTIASDPKHLGAQIAAIAILHTWGQNLLLHPHIHCVIHPLGLPRCRTPPPAWPCGSSPVSFLITRQRPEWCLAGQVSCCPKTPPPLQQPAVCRSGRESRRSTTVRKPAPSSPSSRLGGLREACLRRSHAGVTVFRSLHPSRGHFQSPLVKLRSRARHFPLEGLCS